MNGKVKLSMCLIKHYTMKMGWWRHNSTILDLSTRWKLNAPATLPSGKSILVPVGLDTGEKSCPAGNQTQAVQPVAIPAAPYSG